MSGLAIERFGRVLVARDASGPRQFVRDTLLVPHGMRERWSLRMGHLHPDAVTEAVLRADGLPAGSRYLPLRAAIGAAAERATAPAWIQIDDYEGARGRAIVLLFASPHAERPFAVAKVRPGLEGASLFQERVALQSLSVSNVASTIPQVRSYGEFEGAEVLLMTAMPGRSMDREMKAEYVPRAHVRRHFARARRWLTTFQAGRELGAHGDFWARNILLSDAGTSIVDWEHFDPNGDPLDDVFHFALTYAVAFRWEMRQRADAVERFRRGFATRNVVAYEIRAWLAHFAEARRMVQPAMRRRMRMWMERGAEGRLARPALGEGEWAAMLEIFEKEALCVFSG